ncbi:MAG: hypothetical protein SGJ00_03655 [bacterium]|nr:hypothetical protein [bacterium]
MTSSFESDLHNYLTGVYPQKIEILSSFPCLYKLIDLKLIFCLYTYEYQLNTEKTFFQNPFLDCNFVWIYEDQWHLKNEIIKSRIHSLLSLNKKISARTCLLKRIDKGDCDKFMAENHLIGSTQAGFKYGLFLKNELVAVATFSKARVMVDSDVYYHSYELIGFANKKYFTVVGGLQKLIKNFILEKNVVHLMTYIDLDWGMGNAFKKMGFKEIEKTTAQLFQVNPNTHQRFKYNPLSKGLISVQNAGSLKMILDLRYNEQH